MKTVFTQILLSLVFISIIVAPTLAFDMQMPEDNLGGSKVLRPAVSPVSTGELKALAARLDSKPNAAEGVSFKDQADDDQDGNGGDDLEGEEGDAHALEASESDSLRIVRLDKKFSDYVMRTFVRSPER